MEPPPPSPYKPDSCSPTEPPADVHRCRCTARCTAPAPPPPFFAVTAVTTTIVFVEVNVPATRPPDPKGRAARGQADAAEPHHSAQLVLVHTACGPKRRQRSAAAAIAVTGSVIIVVASGDSGGC